jgi:hypothetical protein
MIDTVRTIKEGIESVISSVLGPTYKKLTYVENVEKNNYNVNSNRYGVRALAGGEVPGVTKNVHIVQAFEIVLSKAYRESSLNDTEQSEKSLDNFNNILTIYKELVNTKASVPSSVLNITDLQLSEPEYIAESKVVIQRATMSITYRFSLI